MRYDSIIIGGGLSGLICGLQLVQAGRRVAIVSVGQSALHFSSGSFDLLGSLPNGEVVTSPTEGVKRLVEIAPSHPYAKIGVEEFESLACRAEALLCSADVSVSGSPKQNHYRLTPMGVLKSAWLTIDGYVRSEQADGLAWKRVALFNAEGFLDFYTQFIADELRKLGTTCLVHTFNLPALEPIRNNPTEMRSANIARIFDNEANVDALAAIIAREAGDCEAVLLPAFLGIANGRVLDELREKSGREIYVVATLPPSVPGVRAQLALRRAFERAGGVYMLGDVVVGYDMVDGRIAKVYSANHSNIGLEADDYVLATGSYFSRGLEATREGVCEPIFGLDVDAATDRSEWYRRDLFEAQPFEKFGVVTDEALHAVKEGKAVENLYVCGAGLSGFNPVKEQCGAGVSMLTALRVADNILKK